MLKRVQAVISFCWQQVYEKIWKYKFPKLNIKPQAKYIPFRCYDGYDVGIPIERGLSEGTILAYDMNGASLTAEHGYPLRAR